MNHSNQITVRAFLITTLFFTVGTSILIAPAGLALHAKQDAWLAAIGGAAMDVAIAWLYACLGDRHPGETPVQYSQTLLGKWGGGAVGLLFAGFCYFLSSLVIADMGYFLSTQIMPETPIESLIIIFVVLVAITVREGMPTYTRASEVLFPFVVLPMIILIIPLFSKFDVEKLKPFFESGIRPVWEGSVSFFSLQEMAVLAMLYPYVSKGRGRRRVFLAGTAIGGGVLVLITVGCLVVLEADLTANHLYPAYALAKEISLGSALERIEGMLMFIWIVSIFVKTVVCFHASVLGIAQTFGVPDGKTFVWPLAMGMIPLALFSYDNIVDVSQAIGRSWTAFASVFLVAIPLLLLGLSFLRSFRKRWGSASS